MPGGDGGGGTPDRGVAVYHGDPAGSAYDRSGVSLCPLRAAWTSPDLDGQVYGEPLLARHRVLVATENDTVYALSATSGAIIWSAHVGTPVPSEALPCGNISPVVGITSTPVVDDARGEIFVVADELGGHGISHHLVGLSIDTGVARLDNEIDPPGSDPAAHLQRAALTAAQGRVIVSFGGNSGDCATYHGWVVGVPEAGGSPSRFEVDPSPGNDQGAIWMGGASPAIDQHGDCVRCLRRGYRCRRRIDVPAITPRGTL